MTFDEYQKAAESAATLAGPRSMRSRKNSATCCGTSPRYAATWGCGEGVFRLADEHTSDVRECDKAASKLRELVKKD